MNRKLSFVILVILILGINYYSHAQQAPPESPPNPYQGEVKKSGFHFSHLSDADLEKGGTWYYEREIQNFHDQKLKVYWHSLKPYIVLIDGFASPKGEESEKVINNVGGLGVYKGVKSSLEYGRTALANRKETNAYIAAEHSSHSLLWSVVKMALYFGEQKFTINMKLVSRFQKGEFTYQITNLGKDNISFLWDSALSPDFLKQTEIETIFVQGKDSRRISFRSTAKPVIKSRSVLFLHPKIREVILGSAFAPAFVPLR